MANEIYAVVRTDLMAGTELGPKLASVRYFDEKGETAAIENGCVLKLEALLEGEREVRKGVAPAADTSIKDIVLIATPEVMYDERKKNLDEFINEAGANCRGYRLHEHDMFSVTAKGLNIAEGASPEVGWAVELMAGTKLNLVASATAGSTQIGKLHAIEKAGRYTYYVVEVI